MYGRTVGTQKLFITFHRTNEERMASRDVEVNTCKLRAMVVSVLPFYSDDLSFNPAKVYTFYVKLLAKRTKTLANQITKWIEGPSKSTSNLSISATSFNKKKVLIKGHLFNFILKTTLRIVERGSYLAISSV